MGIYKRGVVISGVVSLTMGNSPFPFGDGAVAHSQAFSQFPLGQSQTGAQGADQCPGFHRVHGRFPLSIESIPQNAAAVTQRSGEVVFSLLGGVLLLGDPLPGALGLVGLCLIVGGMVGGSLSAGKQA